MYAEMIEKLHASNMKVFTYPSEAEVFTSLSSLLSVAGNNQTPNAILTR